MNIHAFGDSFVALYDDDAYIIERPYLQQIAEYFSASLINYGEGASALEFTFGEVYKNLSAFNKGDILILVLTAEDRQYFFDDPTLGNYETFEIRMPNSMHNEKQAWLDYIKYLSNNERFLKEIRTIFFLHYLHQCSEKLNLKTIILHGFENDFNKKINSVTFPNFSIAKGTLSAIANEEFLSISARVNYFNKYGMDPRANHLSQVNHDILTKKIIKNVENNVNIDLTTEFEKNLIK